MGQWWSSALPTPVVNHRADLGKQQHSSVSVFKGKSSSRWYESLANRFMYRSLSDSAVQLELKGREEAQALANKGLSALALTRNDVNHVISKPSFIMK